MIKNNQDIRQEMADNDLPYWMVAAEIGISESTLIRWMRLPLSDDKKAQVEEAIDSLATK
ncbi:MAG: hypothetical protein PUA95_03335 [Lactimicrobium massiliense]|nr:hypothetical protein [Lactimicrobium massiliense]MDD6229748.1 hypothetical protein [Lactimicrobium massiliense]